MKENKKNRNNITSKQVKSFLTTFVEAQIFRFAEGEFFRLYLVLANFPF